MALLEESASYHLVPSMSDETQDAASTRLRTFEPGLAEREQLVLDRLGTHGWGRWQYFRQCFSGSWGEGTEKPVSPRAQEAFFAALSSLRFDDGKRPSLFLTDEGNLELAWHDQTGGAIQIEFGPRESEIYIESSGVEESVPNDRLAEVLARYFPA